MNNLKEISKIYHISDIHIRNSIRHDEYREVFQKLYEFIRTDRDENSVIILTGDIVHAKTDMTPEATMLQLELYRNLSDMCTTVIITGNHDTNLNNKRKLDALTPIIEAMDHPNLHYWKYNGVYELGDVSFSVMSVYSNPDMYFLANEIETDNKKIALFHGGIDKSKTDIGFEIKNKNMPLSLFDGFDLVLLGDIHKSPQFLNDAKTIAYPGSLIQQNHGEDISHGILVWDMKTFKPEFKVIENAYGYYTIQIENDEIITNNWKKEIPKKARLRILYQDTNLGKLKELITEIAKVSDLIEVTQSNVKDRSVENIESEDILHDNILDPEYQNDLIRDYLEVKYGIEGDILDDIYKLNRTINSKLNYKSKSNNVVWKPLRFEFSNMFSYGKDNLIDFTTIKGLNGLFAPNASGKSSILDALVFCMFDKCSRTSKAVDVLNTKCDTFDCLFEFEMNGNIYLIKRHAYIRTTDSRGNRVASCDVDFVMVDKNGKEHNLNGERRDDTNRNIRELIGTYDDFILTSMSLQASSTEFVRSSQRERKDILSRFWEIVIFDGLYNIAKDEIKETASEIKILKKGNYDDKSVSAKKENVSLTRRFDELYELRSKIAKGLETTNAQIIELTLQLQTVDEELDVDVLTRKLAEVTDKKVNVEKQKVALENDLMPLETLLDTLNSKFATLDGKVIEQNVKVHGERSVILSEKEREFNDLSIRRDAWQKQVEHLRTHEYDPECKYCVQNEFVKSAENAQNHLTNTQLFYDTLAGEIEQLKKIIDESHAISNYNEYQEYVESIADKERKIELLQSKVESFSHECNSLTLEAASIQEKIVEANKLKTAIESNTSIRKEISSLNDVVKNYEDKMEVLSGEILEVSGNIKVNENIIEESAKSITRLSELDHQYKAYEYYLLAIKHDALPYYLIEKLLPMLEGAVNNILAHMVDFSLNLFADGKNINAYINYGDGRRYPAEMTSGMEMFVTSLAIRVALINSSNLPRPNFISIDEGFGVLDADNLNSLYRLFNFLNTQFNFVLCISHLSAMRDFVDGLIEVHKVDNFSKVNHSGYLYINDKEE